MRIISFPVPAVPFYEQKIADLDGADYLLRLEWNSRSGWFLGMADSSGDAIFAPRRLVVNSDLLEGQTDPRLPPGLLLLIDRSGALVNPGYEDLSVRCLLTYSSVDDLRGV